jgi:hypothetical protein
MLAVLLLLLATAARVHAADCSGGGLRAVDVTPGKARLQATVTRDGLTPAAFVASGVDLVLEDADDGTVVYRLQLPADRFVTRGKSTKYDRRGALHGTLRIRQLSGQADTIVLDLRDTRAATSNTSTDRNLLVRFAMSGGACARTCVASCETRGVGSLDCKRSFDYVPFADQGFGQRTRRSTAATSGFCGLHVAADDPCDFLIDERCILPYPSSRFLQADPTTSTGARVHYPADGLPANTAGKHIDPTDHNTLDGFSPGATILALFPDTGHPVDLAASGAPFHTSYARSLEADSPTVLLDANTETRVVHFAEMDQQSAPDDVQNKAMIIRPGVRLKNATRYIVAIRHLVDTEGTPIVPRLAFRALRDGVPDAELAAICGTGCAEAINARRPVFETLFTHLENAGVDRGDLLLAWDFGTASTHALTDWIVSIRDQAFALGTPAFTVTKVDNGNGAGRNASIYARIEGTFQAPLFMTADAPGSRLNLVNGVPKQNGYATVPFVVDIPHYAVNVGGAPRKVRPTLWGHGLLGNRNQVTSLSTLANGFGFAIAGVDMQGMSDQDTNTGIIPAILDYSLFHNIPERLHQGFLNHLLLGRLLLDPVMGFNSHPAFSFGNPPTPILDTTEVFYSGGSQGGIFGIAIMSIAEDFKRGFLAVPGANYSTLLHRSVDFNPFLALSRTSYPNRLDEQLILALNQQLWDRAEPQGYMDHMLDGTLSDPPVPHKVLIHMATYDCEVSNVATEIMVRSLGVPQVTPAARSFFQIPETTAPFDGSAFVEVNPQLGFSRCDTPEGDDPGLACTTNADCPGVGDKPTRTVCDSGIPPLSNTAPRFNNRAHGSTGNLTTAAQIDAFLRPDGDVENFCDGPCDPE